MVGKNGSEALGSAWPGKRRERAEQGASASANQANPLNQANLATLTNPKDLKVPTAPTTGKPRTTGTTRQTRYVGQPSPAYGPLLTDAGSKNALKRNGEATPIAWRQG